MAEYLTLKSQALEIYDYHQADISQFLTGFTPDEAQLEKDMQRQLRRYGKVVSVDSVEPGDTAVLHCRSDKARFNRENVTLVVGKGLLDRTLEQNLLGMAPGQCRCLESSEGPVEVELLSTSRSRLPERTDEAIAALGIEGIRTVNDLRLRCLQKQIEGFLLEDENPDMASAYVWQEVAKNSRFQRDEEEVAWMDRRAEKKFREMSQNPEIGEAALEEGEDVSDWDVLTKDVFLQINLTELDLAVAGQELLRREDALLTPADYEARLEKLAAAYPERSRAQLMELEPQFDFVTSFYADLLARRIDAYVAQCYRDAFLK